MIEQPEKVIFRVDKKKAYDRVYYYAVFPESEDSTNGLLSCLPFYEDTGYGTVDGFRFECYGTMNMNYYYNETKPVHKNSELANRLMNVLQKYYPQYSFRVAEKIVYK